MAENVLGGLLGYSNALKRRIRGLLNDPVNFLESALYDVIPRPEESAAVDPRNLSATPFDSPYVQKTLQMGGLLGPTVWHGSPYKFTKFDSSKIGSGEGAQAYGYGHYVAENPRVALDYKNKLEAGRGIDDADVMARVLNALRGDKVAASQEFLRRAESIRNTSPQYVVGGDPVSAAKRFEDLARRVLHDPDPRGALYKIDLPDEAAAKMLDWDKPLGDQPIANVVAAELRKRLIPSGLPDSPPFSGRGYDGGQIYREIAQEAHQRWKSPSQHPARDAAEFLRSLGIPGIRYLDQGSRGTGKGTYNYVVFPGNEDLLRILEINGQPVNALKGLLGQ